MRLMLFSQIRAPHWSKHNTSCGVFDFQHEFLTKAQTQIAADGNNTPAGHQYQPRHYRIQLTSASVQNCEADQ